MNNSFLDKNKSFVRGQSVTLALNAIVFHSDNNKHIKMHMNQNILANKLLVTISEENDCRKLAVTILVVTRQLLCSRYRNLKTINYSRFNKQDNTE